MTDLLKWSKKQVRVAESNVKLHDGFVICYELNVGVVCVRDLLPTMKCTLLVTNILSSHLRTNIESKERRKG